jgi:hypothetical protein
MPEIIGAGRQSWNAQDHSTQENREQTTFFCFIPSRTGAAMPKKVACILVR